MPDVPCHLGLPIRAKPGRHGRHLGWGPSPFGSRARTFDAARRALIAAACFGLCALTSGCVGLGVQLRHTEELDPAVTARALTADRVTSGDAAAVALPRAPRPDERVRTTRDGERTTYTYRRDTQLACWHFLVLVPVPTPGCDDVDVYTLEGGELVAAKARRYPVTGFLCSYFFLAIPAEMGTPKDTGLCIWSWNEIR